jgi:hypothetical protein
LQPDAIGLKGGITPQPTLPGPLDILIPGTEANNQWVRFANGIINKIKDACTSTGKVDCDKQWKDARNYCIDLYADGYRPRPGGKGVGVGGMNLEQCIAGQVTEACGGNLVE